MSPVPLAVKPVIFPDVTALVQLNCVPAILPVRTKFAVCPEHIVRVVVVLVTVGVGLTVIT